MHKIGFYSALSIVVANMIGTGVFTSLGYQVGSIHSTWGILLLWVIGGVLALCGALTYGEIGSAFPENGGEYNYLSRLYHPALGFLSGWVSIIVGFAAPIAASASALSHYLGRLFPGLNTILVSCTVIGTITIIHSFNLRSGSLFQRSFTCLKVIFILGFIMAGLFYEPAHHLPAIPFDIAFGEILSPGFAVALIYVTYAYSGWNGATYMAAELKNPAKDLPRALCWGTFVVLILYTLLNFIFLYTVPAKDLENVVEIGYLSADHIFGVQKGRFMSLIIASLLVSTISAMILAGPRVIHKMGKDLPALSFFAISNKNGVPYFAVVFQSVIALILLLTARFESIITYVSFTLNLFTFLTVLGIFILRTKFRHINAPFKVPLYPMPPLIFLLIIGWILTSIIIQNPLESAFGILTVSAGLVFYFLVKQKPMQI
jgi:APA family basic amino acid/polyamine antiporter